MKLKPKSSSTYQGDLAPAGTHAAACVGVVDLGTHTERGFQGEAAKPQHKLYLVWELTEEATRTLFAKAFTASLHEKATLRKWLKSWRGGKDLDENVEFDVAQLAGKKCLITIEHKPSGDRTYANAVSVTAPMKGMAIKEPQVKPFTFSLEDGQPFRGPDWLPFLYGKSIEEWVSTCAELTGGKTAEEGDGEEPRYGGPIPAEQQMEEAPF